MARFLDKLLAIASDSIVPSTPDLQSLIRKLQPWGRLGTDLAKLLAQRNGFWAYESALLVRPSTNASAPLGLFEWND